MHPLQQPQAVLAKSDDNPIDPDNSFVYPGGINATRLRVKGDVLDSLASGPAVAAGPE